MSRKTVFDYARLAVEAEQRILDLLEGRESKESLSDCSAGKPHDHARLRPNSGSPEQLG
ncbi:MAG: hypothetical protein ACUVRS_12505 [Armatimonadota bacterium]